MLLYDIIARGATEYPERRRLSFGDSEIPMARWRAVNRLRARLQNMNRRQ